MKNKIDMKSLVKIALGLFIGMYMVTACSDSDDGPASGFTVDKKEITLGTEGGSGVVNVNTEGKWGTRVSQPWVKVMPANGIGITDCDIVVDTTLASTVRHAVITFYTEGQGQQEVEIHQTGYGKMIGLSKPEVELENMAAYGKRYFELSLTTNVNFKIVIPADAKKWLTLEGNPSVELNYGARPQTTKVRFNWSMNTEPTVREASITFEPKNEEDTLEQEAVLLVKQKAAPEINDNRTGDSVALIIINEKLRTAGMWNTSEKMEYWTGITLWEKTDEGVTPEMIGRVRSAEFRIMNTKEGLPAELAHLKYIETLIFYGNTNTMLLPDNFTMGTALSELEHLKYLTVAAYGLTGISPMTELKKPRLTLIGLDLSSNNFTSLPAAVSSNNFPELRALRLNSMRRYSSLNDMQHAWRDNAGLKLNVSNDYNFKKLLKWENLQELSLSFNYLYGQLPDLKNEWDVKSYTDAQIAENDTLNSASDANKIKLKTIPRVLPNIRAFSINLNFMTGKLPEWLLYHPRFAVFVPYTFVTTQDEGYDPDGKVPGFTNEPLNLDYFYEFYPAAKPTKTE